MTTSTSSPITYFLVCEGVCNDYPGEATKRRPLPYTEAMHTPHAHHTHLGADMYQCFRCGHIRRYGASVRMPPSRFLPQPQPIPREEDIFNEGNFLLDRLGDERLE